MLPYREAIQEILKIRFSAGSEIVPLLQASGRILAKSVTTPWPLPRFDNSSMDGFAVRCSDLAEAAPANPVSLPIMGESAAGAAYPHKLQSGECVRISTGAQIPSGADSIVPVERVLITGQRVLFMEVPEPGKYIRSRGDDVPNRAPLLGRGKRIDPAVLALLTSFNIPDVDVLKPPRVAILTSGNELKQHGQPLLLTDVVASSLYYLEEELRAFGCAPRVFGIAPDEPAKFRALFEEALAWGDILVTTAGVSVGEHDHVGATVKALRGHVLFWKVAVRPGKPMLAAMFGEKPFFGLPGNPVSTCCNTELFLKPFLRQAMGMAPVETPEESMRLVAECPRDPQRLFFVYGRAAVVDGLWAVEPLPNQSSGNVSNPAHANCLIVVDPGDGKIPAGQTVRVKRIGVGL